MLGGDEMLKKLLKRSLLALAVLVAVFALTGCPREPSMPSTYTVWTFYMTQSDFNDYFDPDLTDVRTYEKYNWTEENYSWLKGDLSKGGISSKNWTEEEVKKWFTDRYVPSEQAGEFTIWTLGATRRMIALCVENTPDNIVYCLLH